MSGGIPLAILCLWAVAVGAYAWLLLQARRRAILLSKLSSDYAGFVRARFSWATLTVEPVELSFVRMVGAVAVPFRLRFNLPSIRSMAPSTTVEYTLPEAVFGAVPGRYDPRDHRSGRGLFMGGANITGIWGGFAGLLPGIARPMIRWERSAASLTIPALPGSDEEPWVRLCIDFMCASAEAVWAANARGT